MLHKIPIPHYFQSQVKAEIGEVYAYSAIGYFARSMMLLFEPIFMYAVLGLSVTKILWFFAAVYGIYIVIMPFGAKLASMWGYRHVMVMSVPFLVAYWFSVMFSQSLPLLLLIAPVLYAVQKTLLWPAYNALMARYSDSKQMGREFGVVYAIFDVMHILGPFVGGVLAQKFGLQITFIVSIIVYATSAVPLLLSKEIFTPKLYNYKDTWEFFKTYPKHFLGYLGFGEQAGIFVAWPIFIYLVVKNYESTGLLATIASFIAAFLAIIIGKVSDKYTKRVLIKVGAFFTALVWAARFLAKGFLGTLFIDGLSKASRETAIIPSWSLGLIRAKSSHILSYVVFFEQSIAIGTFITLMLSILLFSLTGSFMVLFVLAGLISLLYMFI